MAEMKPGLHGAFVILVTGSRRISLDTVGAEGASRLHRALLLAGAPARFDQTVVLRHGGAKGWDTIAAGLAKRAGWKVDARPADWETHGKAAGTLRNKELVNTLPKPNVCVAAPLHDSVGTWDCIRRCKKAGVPVIITKVVEVSLTGSKKHLGCNQPTVVGSQRATEANTGRGPNRGRESHMGTVEDIFAGAGDVGGGGFANLPALKAIKVGDSYETRHCTSLLTLTRLEAFTAKVGKQDYVSAEFHVNQVLVAGQHALTPGTTIKHMWCLDRDRTNDLTFRGLAEMKRVKGFFAAMYIQAGILVTDENCTKLMALSCKGAMGADMDAADAAVLGAVLGTDGKYPAYPSPIGTQVVCQTFDEGTRSDKPEHSGKTYATDQWSAPPKV